jgi:hypothetical protein
MIARAVEHTFSNDEDSPNKILISPNPANDFLAVESSIYKISRVRVLSVSGQVLIDEEYNDFNALVKIGSLANASYIVLVNDHYGESKSFIIIKN